MSDWVQTWKCSVKTQKWLFCQLLHRWSFRFKHPTVLLKYCRQYHESHLSKFIEAALCFEKWMDWKAQIFCLWYEWTSWFYEWVWWCCFQPCLESIEHVGRAIQDSTSNVAIAAFSAIVNGSNYSVIVLTKRKAESSYKISHSRKVHNKTYGGLVVNCYERRNTGHTHEYVCLYVGPYSSTCKYNRSLSFLYHHHCI